MIDYAAKLNPAQLKAVTSPDGPILVVAGAGTGKTRTIVYRLAWLAEHGVPHSSILLLTFTRKAAAEMLTRAGNLLNQDTLEVQGGTFHAFAFSVLRKYPPLWLEGKRFTVMDGPDISSAIAYCKDTVKLATSQGFPKSNTLVALISKARNLEIPIAELVQQEAQHLMMHTEAIESVNQAYTEYRRKNCLMDFDDLLFELDALLAANDADAASLRRRYSNILVDEYQDTNRIQARITQLLAAPQDGRKATNVMAVGDEAQSIYSFRGASVRNILDFPRIFEGTTIVRLEQNYRSTQPILNIANAVLSHAAESYGKKLFTKRTEGAAVRVVHTANDKTQAQIAVNRIRELLNVYVPSQIAVLFRAGFHSYQLEMALNHASIPFRKYGGLKYTETAHTKDLLAFARLMVNVADMPAFLRVAAMHPGVGAKTGHRLHDLLTTSGRDAFDKAAKRYPGLVEDFALIDQLRESKAPPSSAFPTILEHYTPRLQTLYPDDWPRRTQDLDEVLRLSAGFADMEVFLAEVTLETPDEESDGEHVVLSTVHSAKGLEWDAVLIIDLVEDRFPSFYAKNDVLQYEEERRLFYVACTRARHQLDLYSPRAVFNQRFMNFAAIDSSVFLNELPSHLHEAWEEGRGGRLLCMSSPPMDRKPRVAPEHEQDSASPSDGPISGGTFCQHKIYGRGTIIRMLPDNKALVDFAGIGAKTLSTDQIIIDD